MREIARELHVCFFGLQRPFSFNTCVSPIRRVGSDDRAHSARGHPNRRITKITRNVNAPLYDGLDDRAHCAHGHPNRRIVFFNTRVYGEK